MSDSSLDDLTRLLEELPREAWDRPDPPAAPWPAEEQRATDEKRAPRGRRLVLRPLAAFAGSAALVAAGVLAGLAVWGGDGDGSKASGAERQRVELNPIGRPNRSASGTAEIAGGPGGDASVRLSGLRPNSDRDFYELWLLGEDGELVSLASFRVPESGSATLDLPLPVDPSRFRYLDVSREPTDGDPTHSTISVLRGPTA